MFHEAKTGKYYHLMLIFKHCCSTILFPTSVVGTETDVSTTQVNSLLQQRAVRLARCSCMMFHTLFFLYASLAIYSKVATTGVATASSGWSRC